jgi:hypothetical protein
LKRETRKCPKTWSEGTPGTATPLRPPQLVAAGNNGAAHLTTAPRPRGRRRGRPTSLGRLSLPVGVFRGISSFSGSEEFDGAEAGLFQITGLNLFVERSANLAASVRPGRSGGTSLRSTPGVRATPESQLRYASIGTRLMRARRPRAPCRTSPSSRRCTRPGRLPG